MKKFQVDTNGTLTTNLVAYYKLEDATDFWGSYNLTNNNSISFTSGKVNNCGDSGSGNTNRSLTNSTSSIITSGTMPLSVSAWVNVNEQPGALVDFISVQDGDVFIGYELGYRDVSGTKKIFAERFKPGVADDIIEHATTLTIGTWYHLVLTWDGSTLKLYLNNSLVVSGAFSGVGNANRGDGISLFARITSGGTPLSERFASAKMDEVGIWSKALSTQEISDLYNGGAGQTMIEVFPSSRRLFFMQM
jgi:hypothetical protein